MEELGRNYLIALARLKAVESRATLEETIADLFSDSGEFLSDKERAGMSAMLRSIVADVEQTLRHLLADEIAKTFKAPKEVLESLRRDESTYMSLARGTALQAGDLIEAVRNRYLEYRLGLALRQRAEGPQAPATKATERRETVAEALVRAPDADIARTAMDYLLEHSKRIDTTRGPTIRAEELGVALNRRMFFLVSAALREDLIRHLNLDEIMLDETLERLAFEECDRRSQSSSENISEILASHIAESNLLKPDVLVSSLSDGQVGLFMALFAKATGLRTGLVRRIVFEPGGEGLAIACKAIGAPRDLFARMFALTRLAHPELAAQIRIETRKALAFYDLLKEEEAYQVLRKWRLTPEYAAAVRELQLGSLPADRPPAIPDRQMQA